MKLENYPGSGPIPPRQDANMGQESANLKVQVTEQGLLRTSGEVEDEFSESSVSALVSQLKSTLRLYIENQKGPIVIPSFSDTEAPTQSSLNAAAAATDLGLPIQISEIKSEQLSALQKILGNSSWAEVSSSAIQIPAGQTLKELLQWALAIQIQRGGLIENLQALKKQFPALTEFLKIVLNGTMDEKARAEKSLAIEGLLKTLGIAGSDTNEKVDRTQVTVGKAYTAYKLDTSAEPKILLARVLAVETSLPLESIKRYRLGFENTELELRSESNWRRGQFVQVQLRSSTNTTLSAFEPDLDKLGNHSLPTQNVYQALAKSALEEWAGEEFQPPMLKDLSALLSRALPTKHEVEPFISTERFTSGSQANANAANLQFPSPQKLLDLFGLRILNGNIEEPLREAAWWKVIDQPVSLLESLSQLKPAQLEAKALSMDSLLLWNLTENSLLKETLSKEGLNLKQSIKLEDLLRQLDVMDEKTFASMEGIEGKFRSHHLFKHSLEALQYGLQRDDVSAEKQNQFGSTQFWWHQGQWKPIQVFHQKKEMPKGQVETKDGVKIEISMQTPRMGKVACVLNASKKAAKGRLSFTNEGPHVGSLFQSHARVLRDKLAARGFELEGWEYSLGIQKNTAIHKKATMLVKDSELSQLDLLG